MEEKERYALCEKKNLLRESDEHFCGRSNTSVEIDIGKN